MAALPASTFGAEALDQQQTTYDGFSGNSLQCVGQTFIAGKSGHLTHVSLYVQKLTDHPIMRVEIRSTAAGVPSTTVLATTDVPGTNIGTSFGWVDFVFSTPPVVAAGTQYAIVAPPLGPMEPGPGPWGFAWGGAEQTISLDPYPDGMFVSSSNGCDGPYGATSHDLAFQTYVDQADAFQPDGRIRVGFGPWIGGNVYNDTGDGQSRAGFAHRRDLVLFRIGIQNDGIVRDRFKISAEGAAASGYRVRYFFKTREITSAVEAGTYLSRSLNPGYRQTIEAWVKVRTTAAAGSNVGRLLTITSVNDPSVLDAVKFKVSRR
jgi:hypothetical protein